MIYVPLHITKLFVCFLTWFVLLVYLFGKSANKVGFHHWWGLARNKTGLQEISLLRWDMVSFNWFVNGLQGQSLWTTGQKKWLTTTILCPIVRDLIRSCSPLSKSMAHLSVKSPDSSLPYQWISPSMIHQLRCTNHKHVSGRYEV